MKGVVFNLLEQIVSAEHGEETWDDLLDDAGVDGAYTSLGSYEDADLMAIVGAASQRLGVPPEDVVRWFGRNAIPHFVAGYPQLFEGHGSTRSLLLSLNDIIHPEVRKLYPGAGVPDFGYDTDDPAVLRMTYHSTRRLCAFAEGLIQGTSDHFGETVAIAQPQCMLRGDDHCLLEVSHPAA